MGAASWVKMGVGLALIAVGLAMLLIVFYTAYQAALTFKLEFKGGGSLAEAISENSRVLIELLVRVAFLAVALAAGSIVLGKGVEMVRG